jgi:hypothetical protein
VFDGDFVGPNFMINVFKKSHKRTFAVVNQLLCKRSLIEAVRHCGY